MVLKRYDLLISEIASSRQKRRSKVRSRKLDNRVEKFRGFMKNQINRVLNRNVEIHKQRPDCRGKTDIIKKN